MSVTGDSGERVFAAYASFYDALYRDKDYEAECDDLERAFRSYSPDTPRSVLDLGCGTGGHVLPMARRGFEMTGVDRSPEMIQQARSKAAQAGLEIDYRVGDIRHLHLGRIFDAVISMFAVMGYQYKNDDLAAAMCTARMHLKPGGLFVFDAWFGPAVLMQRPGTTSKRVTLDDGEVVERRAESVLDLVSQTVEVRYVVTGRRGELAVDEARESHRMRYLFPREVAYFLEVAGFQALSMAPFMDPDGDLDEETWNFTVVAQAV